MKSITLLLSLLCLFFLQANAGSKPKTTALFDIGKSKGTILFDGNTAQYRIPSIVQCKSGKLIAFTDHRYGGGDVGWGRIDIVMKESFDNGKTWSKTEKMVAEGGKDTIGFGCAHGDAATVVDRETGDILMMCASGSVSFWYSKRSNPLRMGRYISHDDGKTWSGKEVTSSVYDLMPNVQQAFFTSGRIFQSNIIKVGSHYRIYSVVVTRQGNRVMYSDDFGETWSVLGGKDGAKAAPKGDEAKIEELPDGSLLLSSRVTGGRYFNIFHYTNDAAKAEGYWNDAIYSSKDCNGIDAKDNATDGELLIVDAKQGKKKVKLLLQSVPFGPNRENVGIYFKALNSPKDYATPEAIADDWEGRYQVSHTSSAYSTMIQTKDGNIPFLYEENSKENHYDIVFKSLTIKEITNGRYK